MYVLVPSFAQGTGSSSTGGSLRTATPGAAPIVDERQLTIGGGNAVSAPAASAPQDEQSAWPYFLRMILVLALVVLAIYGTFRLLKSVSKPKTAEDQFIKVLASTQLGPGRWLYVVALGARSFLVGSADSGVSLIAEIDDKELIDALNLRAASSPPERTNDFASLLQALLKPKAKLRQGTDGADAAGNAPGTDFLERQRERLKKL